jgi:hypothetical protein
MAIKPKTISKIDSTIRNAYVVSWTGLANGDSGEPLELPGQPDRSAQVIGTFGVGGSVVIEGSNNETDFSTLTTPLGTSIALSSPGIAQVQELTKVIRPRVVAGDGSTSVSVYMLIAGPYRY